ncbi:helix-turn-helix domain-containing protein [Pseudonocardia benzenivorans]|uniref:Helix-turn-helix domain-containing protein n=1 Tax=Pseudonocardia benzenivorans TaxID=228005 RepID=A0ABW3VBT6_9PSEU
MARHLDWEAARGRGLHSDSLHDLAGLAFEVAEDAPLQRVLSHVARNVTDLPGVLYGGVYLLGDDATTLQLEGWHGLTAEYLKVMREMPLDLASGTAATGPPNVRAVLTATTILVPDVFAETELGPWLPLFRPQGFRGIAAVPMTAPDGAVIGSVTAYLAKGAAPGPADLPVLEELGRLATAVTLLVRRREADRAAVEGLRADLDRAAARMAEQRRLGAVERAALRLSADGAGLAPVVRTLTDGLGVALTVLGPTGEVLAGDPRGDGRSVSASMHVNDDQTMTLQAAVPPQTPPDEPVPWSLDGAALIVELELRRLDRDADIESRLTKDLVADLLSPAAMRHRDAVFGRAVALGHRPQHAHDVVMVALPEVESGSDPTAGVARAHRRVVALTGTVRPRPVVGSVGSHVVVLNPVPTDDRPPGAEGTTRALAARLAAAIAGARVLIGPRARTLADAPHAFDVASRAVQLLTRRSAGVIDMTDLGVPGLLLQSAQPEALRELAERTLAPLVRNDAERGGRLLATLRAWLAAGMSTPETARTMFVHVNTVNYRLRRIGELTGLQPSRPADLIQLQLALTVAEISGSIPPGALRN